VQCLPSDLLKVIIFPTVILRLAQILQFLAAMPVSDGSQLDILGKGMDVYLDASLFTSRMSSCNNAHAT